MMDYEKAFGKLPEDKPMWDIPIELVAYEKKILEQKKRILELEKIIKGLLEIEQKQHPERGN